MHYQKINYPDNDKVWLECYIQDSGLKLGQDLVRPALVICPGGGYVYLSPREAEPVALAYAAKGIQAFVLHYSLGWEVKGFQPLKEMDWAIGLIREHANDWYVDADKILACGFSAGGHLALSSGLLGKNRPNGLILGYPATDMSGQGSELMQMLFFGKEGPAKEEKNTTFKGWAGSGTGTWAEPPNICNERDWGTDDGICGPGRGEAAETAGN